jgi:hypothetical protein
LSVKPLLLLIQRIQTSVTVAAKPATSIFLLLLCTTNYGVLQILDHLVGALHTEKHSPE